MTVPAGWCDSVAFRYHALDEREEALERASAAMGRPTLRIPSGTRDEVLDRLCEAVEVSSWFAVYSWGYMQLLMIL